MLVWSSVSVEALPLSPSVVALVRAQMAEARAEFPGVHVDEDALLRAIVVRAADPASSGELHVKDLWLAHACSVPEASRAALAAFEVRYGSLFEASLRRFRLDAATAEEIAQSVRERLFVAHDDRPPKLHEYSGKGPLSAWLRAVLVRAALDFVRKKGDPAALGKRSEDADDALAQVAGGLGDPELEHLLARYREPFKEAFQTALRALPERELRVLRFAVVDGLNIDAIGQIHGVHRATVARWIAAAREALVLGTRAALAARFPLTSAEFDSITRLCRSQVDVSLVRLLGDAS
jgi:RNA polymerase sigma-70 factor (ECF subfamily)